MFCLDYINEVKILFTKYLMSYKFENEKHYEESVAKNVRSACKYFRQLYPEVTDVKVEKVLGQVNI